MAIEANIECKQCKDKFLIKLQVTEENSRQTITEALKEQFGSKLICNSCKVL